MGESTPRVAAGWTLVDVDGRRTTLAPMNLTVGGTLDSDVTIEVSSSAYSHAQRLISNYANFNSTDLHWARAAFLFSDCDNCTCACSGKSSRTFQKYYDLAMAACVFREVNKLV